VGKKIQAAYGFVIQPYFVIIVAANGLTVGNVSVFSRLFTTRLRIESLIYSGRIFPLIFLLPFPAYSS